MSRKMQNVTVLRTENVTNSSYHMNQVQLATHIQFCTEIVDEEADTDQGIYVEDTPFLVFISSTLIV